MLSSEPVAVEEVDQYRRIRLESSRAKSCMSGTRSIGLTTGRSRSDCAFFELGANSQGTLCGCCVSLPVKRVADRRVLLRSSIKIILEYAIRALVVSGQQERAQRFGSQGW